MLEFVSLDTVCGELARIAPLRLAESWDNVGLLVGDRTQAIRRVLTCLTLSPDVVDEAVAQQADLVVSHHPLPFRPLTKITSDNVTGTLLLRLIRASIAVYSAHTAFDSAADGINELWCRSLGINNPQPLKPPDSAEPDLRSGRYGDLALPTKAIEIVKQAASITQAHVPQFVGDPERTVKRLAVACGSGGSFLAQADRFGCEMLLTGETNYHTCLEAESRNVALGLVGHYPSERFAIEQLAAQVSSAFPQLTVWASLCERDPIQAVLPTR